jgi:hypothetical protein
VWGGLARSAGFHTSTAYQDEILTERIKLMQLPTASGIAGARRERLFCAYKKTRTEANLKVNLAAELSEGDSALGAPLAHASAPQPHQPVPTARLFPPQPRTDTIVSRRTLGQSPSATSATQPCSNGSPVPWWQARTMEASYA